ncbi:MAG TPA: GNAT family N-acetyltransferase, partial [Acidimicrobiales bacterium]
LARWEGDVVLADGGTVHIRPIRPDDGPRIVALHERLSRESRYLRFFSPMPRLSPSLLERFVNVDYVDRMALVAVLGDDIVGVARYDTLDDDPSSAEVAFTVDDTHQGRGVGTVLLEHLAGVAADHGLTRFVADTLPGNTRMLNVFRSAGFTDERRFAAGVVRVTFPIEATTASLAAVHRRERQAAAASVRRLLHPASVAVIGAGRAPLGIGHEVFRNLLRSGFAGPVYPVNRAATSVASVRAYASLAAIPDAVDLAVIAVPAAEVPAVVDECGDKGVTGLVVMSGGFADAGGEGAAAQRALVEQARSRGMRLLGPNSIGVANAAADVRLNATLAQELPRPGRVGFMAQSSALGVAIFEEARHRGIGVSSFVSAGNKADVSGNDLIQYWDEDDGTDVVLLYLESFGNPRTFARVARRLSRRKPVVAVKGGRSASGRLVAGTPWAVPVGSDEVVDALFEHTGVLRVDTLAQLLDVGSVLAHQPLPAGRRVGVVANAGGSGVLVADACEGAGLLVPTLGKETADALRRLLGERAAVANPVTVAGTASADAYEQAVRLLLDDELVDAVVVSFLPPLATPAGEVEAAVGRAAEGSAKPVVANFMTPGASPADRTVPVFAYPEDAAQALARVAWLAEWRARPEGSIPTFDDVDREAAAMIVHTALAEHPDGVDLDLASALDVLRAYRVPVAPTAGVTSADEAMDAAATVGYPVALRALGGQHPPVRLDLASPAAVARAWEELGLAGGPAVVQAMVPPGVETVVDVRTHPSFGPLVSFGTSGPAAEIYGDRALRVLPLSDVDADELIRSVKGAPLLLGYRELPPVDLDALRQLLLRVSRLAQDMPEVASLTLEPVIASSSGATAVDARLAVAPHRPLPELALRRLR